MGLVSTGWYTETEMLFQTTHATLIARLSDRGDHGAWREFYDRYGDVIRSFARRQGLQPVDCEDVVQDVLVSLSKSMSGFRYDPAKGKFRSYLKTVAIRAVFRRKRQDSAGAALDAIECRDDRAAADGDLDDRWELSWRRYHVHLALRRLETEVGEKDRTAFAKYALAGGDAKEIAEALGMSVEQVWQAKSRILKRLRVLIAEQVRAEG